MPSYDQHYCCFYDKGHASNIFVDPYKLWDMDPAALSTLNYTPERNHMMFEFPQPSTHQPKTDIYPLFYSLGPLDDRWKELRVSFAFIP